MFKWLGIDSNDKELKRLQSLVEKINDLEGEYQSLSPEALQAKTAAFKARIAEAIAPIKEKAERQVNEVQQELNAAKERIIGAPAGMEQEFVKAVNQLEEKVNNTKKQADGELR